MKLVASPRNQLHLEQEVAGFQRPLAVSGRAQHSCQVAFQRDLQSLAVGLQQDCLDQPSNGIRCAGTAFFMLQRVTEAADVLAIDIGHPRMKQLRHLRRFKVPLQLRLAGFE